MTFLRFTSLRFTLFRFPLLLASLLTLSGCAPTGDSYPTPIPPEFLPTAVAQTAAALEATRIASLPTLTPTVTARPATLTPTATVTQTPTPAPPAPEARLLIKAPGPMSILGSAMQARIFLIPGETNLVQIALYGEDGRLLARDLRRVNDIPPPGVELTLEIPFEIRTAELARLEISTRDQAGRLETLTSEHLTLLPMGLSQINPSDPPFERAAIYSPANEAAISSGMLSVEGVFWPFNDQPVILELTDETGRALMTRQLALTGDTYIPFATVLPYTVTKPTRARLSIRQADPRFPNAIMYLYSVVINLNPPP